MADCEWRVWQGHDKKWYWGCNKQKTGGPYRHKGQAVAAACAHGVC